MACRAVWSPNPNFLNPEEPPPRSCKDILCEIKAAGGWDTLTDDQIDQLTRCTPTGGETILVTVSSSTVGEPCPAVGSPVAIEFGCQSISQVTFSQVTRSPEFGPPSSISVVSGYDCSCNQGNGNFATITGEATYTTIYFDYQTTSPDPLDDLNCDENEPNLCDCCCCEEDEPEA